jgi:hypothetical protein
MLVKINTVACRHHTTSADQETGAKENASVRSNDMQVTNAVPWRGLSVFLA